jgi:aryl-alcohol dehydrogenase-like predicted oxidoreductase
VLDACRELGIAFVAFSPLARGFLTGKLADPAGEFGPADIRRGMPRFSQENYAKNLGLLPGFREIAREAGCTMAQLALAWLLAKDPIVIPIFGTRKPEYVDENAEGAVVKLDQSVVDRLDALINQRTVAGLRYSAATQQEIDTEMFNFESPGAHA